METRNLIRKGSPAISTYPSMKGLMDKFKILKKKTSEFDWDDLFKKRVNEITKSN